MDLFRNISASYVASVSVIVDLVMKRRLGCTEVLFGDLMPPLKSFDVDHGTQCTSFLDVIKGESLFCQHI